MQNHLLKGMGMLDGMKETQPVFQLWMKGIFEIFRGFIKGTQPLGAQHQAKSKLHCSGAKFRPPTDLSHIWMRFRNNGESRVVPSCWDELGCA